MLARLSQIATQAKAPLAGEHCKANFYVVVTREPEVAGYIGLVGLAEINLDAPDPPQGLSSFDQAFLAAIYRADQSSVRQESAMKRIMLEGIAAQHTAPTP